MRASYKNANGRLTAEFECDTQRELFEQLARFQEVFDEGVCGKCGAENLKFVVRTVEDNHYYEIRCLTAEQFCSLVLIRRVEDYSPRERGKTETGFLIRAG